MASGNDQAFKKPKFVEIAVGKWNELTGFLGDVRAEMRKVVAPGRKEVQVTTWVVLFAVFLFGVFFFIVDWIFQAAIQGPHGLLQKLVGL
jgi:preprotein translocase SecE subunit